MAQLFGIGTIKANVEVLPGFDSSKIEVIKRLYQDWQNWLLDDESKYEQTFNQLFFWDLLGYEDRVNRIPKWWVMWSWIADLTLGNFVDWKYNENEVQIVCELKWAKTNLTKKQFWHGGLSPVWQWFAYKTWLKNCKWLIVSNFFEIRLYRDNTTDFEVWNLEELLEQNEAKEYFNLKKLYLLLNKNNLLASSGFSKTEHLLSHFREDQKEITKKFYKQYKWLRVDLINDIRHNNPEVEIDVVIEKAQKIIDRLIFIFFCEDKGLLPDKKLKENIVRAREAGFSSWEVLVKFFSLVDKGSKTLEIPEGYNGWLFRADEVLNNLNVSDAVCKKFTDLTDYNFDDELSVNVLWQIFEQSITDLENLRVDLLGTEVEMEQLVDTGKWRRKKDWIFYTPEYIVDYIVQNSVMKYLNEKEDECVQKYKKDEVKAYQAYQQILQNIKVLDPACWSWAFLVRVFDVLLEENERVGSVLESLWVKSLFNDTTLYKNILTNNIYGVDLNEESVEITKLSLWLKSAQKNKKLNNLDENIKCWNSLIDDPEIAGDKAFDWNKEFKEIMDDGGFDVIVGNPPYVVTRKDDRASSLYEWNSDLYLMFFESAFKKLLNEKCYYFGFITPKFFLVNKRTVDFRKFLLLETNVIELVETSPFEDAQTECVITIANSKKNRDIAMYIDNDGKIDFMQTVEKKKFQQTSDYIINTRASKENNSIVEKLEEASLLLKNISVSRRWIEIGKQKLREVREWVICLIGQDVDKYSMVFENTFVPTEHKDYKRLQNFFRGEKLYLRRVAKELAAYYDKDLAYNKNIYWIQIYDKNIDSKYVLCLINSHLLTFYYKNKFTTKKSDLFPEIQTYLYEQLPIKEIPLSEQQPFIEKAHKMLSLNKDLYSLLDKFLKRVQDNLHITKITKKLESFYEGDFKAFVAELKKQKIILSLKEQDEREPYFAEYKEKIQWLRWEIGKTDEQIDNMVFDLYGLTDEERKSILNG